MQPPVVHLSGDVAVVQARARDLYDAAKNESLKENYSALFTRFQEALERMEKDAVLSLCVPSGPDGGTPLHCVAGAGVLDGCAMLLELCPKLNFCADGRGRTALHWALRRGFTQTAELLIRHGAPVDALDNDGRTCLHVVAQGGYPRACDLLLCHPGISINAAATCDKTPLHVAAAQGHAEVCEALVRAGADCLALTTKQRTPLHLAVMTGAIDVIPVLLDFDGRAPFVHDADGKRPVDYASDSTAMYLLESEDYLSKWIAYLRPYREMDTSMPALEVQQPRVRQKEWHRVKVSCRVFDREHVIAHYVVEMREGSAESAKKRKFVFFRSRSQRKADEVRFELSRFRSPHGTQRTAMCLDDPEFGVGSPPRRPQSAELWHSGQKYVVRVTAVLEESRWGPRHVESEWSRPFVMPNGG
jgi:hypothetical protein